MSTQEANKKDEMPDPSQSHTWAPRWRWQGCRVGAGAVQLHLWFESARRVQTRMRSTLHSTDASLGREGRDTKHPAWLFTSRAFTSCGSPERGVEVIKLIHRNKLLDNL